MKVEKEEKKGIEVPVKRGCEEDVIRVSEELIKKFNRNLEIISEKYNQFWEKYVEFLKDDLSGTMALVERLENIEEGLETLKGREAHEAGMDWQEELAYRVEAFGYETEVNRSGRGEKSADVVVIEPSVGRVVAVISAKAYSLSSKTGLTRRVKPEMERAKEENALLVVVVKNKNTGQELYHFCEPQNLDDFTCSAPSWFATEEPTEKQRKKTGEGRREFRRRVISRTS